VEQRTDAVFELKRLRILHDTGVPQLAAILDYWAEATD